MVSNPPRRQRARQSLGPAAYSGRRDWPGDVASRATFNNRFRRLDSPPAQPATPSTDSGRERRRLPTVPRRRATGSPPGGPDWPPSRLLLVRVAHGTRRLPLVPPPTGRGRRVRHQHERPILTYEPILGHTDCLPAEPRAQQRALGSRIGVSVAAQIVDRVVTRAAEKLTVVVIVEDPKRGAIQEPDAAARIDDIQSVCACSNGRVHRGRVRWLLEL
jgi:hypothetical protein